MTNYYRVRLGSGNRYAKQCYHEGFIGANYDVFQDLSHILDEDVRTFNENFRPIYKSIFPEKTKASCSNVGGILWRIICSMSIGDVVISPMDDGRYQIGEVNGTYFYEPTDGILAHRRPITWFNDYIGQDQISDALQLSINSRNTVISLDQYADEIRNILNRDLYSESNLRNDAQDRSIFTMEKYLEEFLIANWEHSELGHDYDIFTEDGDIVGQQFLTDTGPLDILAISKDQSTFLVVELKKGRASDAVIGQVMRYMAYVQYELAEPHQDVRGVIIALEDNQRLKRALSMLPNVEFYRYEINFRLIKS